MRDELRFKVSSALKDIIGRDLITDDFIAVFELVKNSFDAYATRVDVCFENIYSSDSKIIIKDNGKGMAYSDLIDKWLFVAYSAKREGTEDESYDYRNSINTHRPYAGAKGIGRFSCDRLGKELYLETTKQENDSVTEVLITDWEKFESDLKSEFVNISVLHETKSQSDYGLKHGTVLEIKNLRSGWDRIKLLRLKASLAKLINPASANENDFIINLVVPEEIENDRSAGDDYNKINGEVRNFIFETLGLKTTKIIASISHDGNLIETELRDGGTLIYRIVETNKYKLLKNISYTLYYLNMSAKLTFTRRMGLPSNRFGHIFLYKNGFRIYPYGEPGEDPLKIDVRKAQGQRRYLGTRDLIGQISIYNDDDQLKETSSRGDGLIRTPTYEQLDDCFREVLRRLERYVVDVQEWGLSIEDKDSGDLNTRITNLIAKLSGGDNIVEFHYNDNFLELIESSQSASAEKVLQNLNKIAIASGNNDFILETKRATAKLESIQAAREEAEREASIAKTEAKEIQKELGEKVSQNLFLQSVKSQDFDEIVSFVHHIGISSSIVDNYLTGLYSELNYEHFDIEEARDIIKKLIFENKKILNISRFATKANFKLTTDNIELDIISYLREYVLNIVELSNNKETKVHFIDNVGKVVLKKFKPIEMNILIDNFLSNSKKAGAKNFTVQLDEENDGSLNILIIDDGKGIPSNNIDKIFNFGFTTLGGSGIGLYHAKEIIARLRGSIKASSAGDNGTTFIINLK